MKKLLLKSKNVIFKSALAFLGFTLAASQCLAQYMAIRPRGSFYGSLKGVTDSISTFNVVFNERDTMQTDFMQDYSFGYVYELGEFDEIKVEVSQDTTSGSNRYLPKTEIIAIEPRQEQTHTFIHLEEKE